MSLCLTRRVGEEIYVELPSGESIRIEIGEVRAKQVRIYIETTLGIYRGEIWLDREKRESMRARLVSQRPRPFDLEGAATYVCEACGTSWPVADGATCTVCGGAA